MPKILHSKGEVWTAFNGFIASKPLEFYHTSINSFVNWWQKSINILGSYFDWLKLCLNSLIQEEKCILSIINLEKESKKYWIILYVKEKQVCSDTVKLICLICMSVRESRYESLTENNCKAWTTPASCRGFFSWLSGIRVGWLDSSYLRGQSPQVLTLFGGVRFIAWCLRRPFLRECRQGLRHFWSHWTRLGHSPAPRPT